MLPSFSSPRHSSPALIARSLRLLALGAALAGCQHGEPFDSTPERPDGPFSQVFPRRLTFSPGDDRTPSWLPDGSGIIYSSERLDRPDHDRCLLVIPAEGGTVRERYCPTDPAQDDSTNLMESPAVAPDGRIFYHTVTSWIGQQKLGDSRLVAGLAADPAGATLVSQVPYTAPNGKVHSSIRSPAWLEPGVLIYLAEELFYEGSTFLPDTFVTGRDIVRLDLTGAAPVFTVLPGTDDASGVSVSEEPGIIYYTLGGDTRVFRRDLATGADSVVLDFAPLGIVRDVSVRGGRVAAVVGRSVVWQFEPDHEAWVQRDEGGDLYLADLQTGDRQVLMSSDSVLFRHPVFSPDGSRIIVEVQPYAEPHTAPDSGYNATNHRADLWLFTLPVAP